MTFYTCMTYGFLSLLAINPCFAINKAVTQTHPMAKVVQSHIVQTEDPLALFAPNLPVSMQLGMSDLSVLDQGIHHTSATFAVTSAIDAIMGKKYSSQFCLLALGQYLTDNFGVDAGWEHASIKTTLNLVEMFGLVSQNKQVTEYPLNALSSNPSLSLNDYQGLSPFKPFVEGLSWSALLDIDQFMVDNVSMDHMIEQVKHSLSQGDRVIISLLIMENEWSYMGKHSEWSDMGKMIDLKDNLQIKPAFDDLTSLDSWVLTPIIASSLKLNAYGPHLFSHTMIITGYNDHAVALDNRGNAHVGLFTLRNSWGDKVGNQGDFYVAYDYFKLLTTELYRMRTYY